MGYYGMGFDIWEISFGLKDKGYSGNHEIQKLRNHKSGARGFEDFDRQAVNIDRITYWTVDFDSVSADVPHVTLPTCINGVGTSGVFVYSDCIPYAGIGGIENNYQLTVALHTTTIQWQIWVLKDPHYSEFGSWRKYCQVEHQIMEANKLQPHYSRPDIRLRVLDDRKFLAMHGKH
uniref:Uncharacterized protein n=1 Tax=Tanacetum cinerariifolium TaxID=118510 RepID=A0A6L2MLA3_TANCI|nr:hypothetical protein [Tanacetum cinerariifolium]